MRMGTIGQIFHHYKKWEDYQNGMWRRITGEERDLFLEKVVKFMRDIDLYGSWMLGVIDQWPITCEHNLTDNQINKKAWIGWAACCLAINCPEDITREGWHYLSNSEQDRANNKATFAINKWEQNYLSKQTTQCPKSQLELMF